MSHNPLMHLPVDMGIRIGHVNADGSCQQYIGHRINIVCKNDLTAIIPKLTPEQNQDHACDAVLESLTFASMNARYEAIEEAHKKTFDWIFQDPQAKNKPWSNYTKWLREDDGIYWFGGKAGSGKSTLMRYIYDDGRTTDLISTWAGDLDYIKARFFYWQSGTADQNSQLGLLSSFIHQILVQRRDLIQAVCPDAWKIFLEDGNYTPDRIYRWDESRANQAFDALCRTYNGKICFFIDGLDECAGSCFDTVKFFKSIVSRYSNIKICLSSRPLHIFKDQFSKTPNLQLEDLTREDIKLYVTDTLLENENMSKIYALQPIDGWKLVNEISDKANGVFLWVKLVVRSFISGLDNNGDQIKDLRNRLKVMPAEIEDLYKYMLQAIEQCYADDAFRIFDLTATAYTSLPRNVGYSSYMAGPPGLTAIELSYALETNESFAITSPMTLLSSEIAETIVKEVDRKLRVCCAGLLEIVTPDIEEPPPEGRVRTDVPAGTKLVQYLHRTTKDFLDMIANLKLLLRANPAEGFEPYSSLLKSKVLVYKTLHTVKPDGWVEGLPEWHFMEAVDWTMRLAHQAEQRTQKPQIKLLDELDLSISRLWPSKAGHWSENISFDYRRPCKWHDDFLSVAVTYALPLYVASKLEIGHEILRSKKGRPYLDYALRPTAGNPTIANAEMVSVLLKHGADPNEKFNNWTAWSNVLYEIKTGKYKDSPRTIIAIMKMLIEHGVDPTATCEELVPIARTEYETQYSTALEVIEETFINEFPTETAELKDLLRKKTLLPRPLISFDRLLGILQLR